MSNKEFFDELQKHSEAKLRILDNYVVPWMRKITMGPYGEKALVIDGFAGTGKYSNSDGSSLRLIKHAIDFCDQAKSYNWNAPDLRLLLIEGDRENYYTLADNISDLTGLSIRDTSEFLPLPNHPSVEICCQFGNFEDVLVSLLESVGDRRTLIPSFCFIDPFGFKDTPFNIIQQYLSNSKSEIFFNFIYEETNRFIRAKNLKVQEHMQRHFGIEDITTLQEMVMDKAPQERKQLIVDFYSRQLLENTDVNYVLNFEIKKGGKTKLILFYGTKNLVGLKVMKKAMWKVDDTGLYMFDDKKETEEIQFSFTKEINDDVLLNDLSNLIKENFEGQKATIESIEEFVLTETIFPIENYAKKALKKLETEGSIVDVSGRKNKGSYPKRCVIYFK